MHVALIGVTGRVGSRLATELLSRGHTVTGLALRLPANDTRAGLTFVAADATDPATLAPLLKGHDAVISAMRFVSSDARALISAVKAASVGRLLVVGGAGSLEVAPGKALVTTAGFPEGFKAEADAGARFLQVLKQEPDLDWTFLSPSADFAPGERTGKFRLGGDQLLTDAAGKSHISMEDFAIAMVDELSTRPSPPTIYCWLLDRFRGHRMRRDELSTIKITVMADGPYAVTGGPPLSKQAIGTNAAGEAVDWLPGETIAVRASYFLCRCGQSSTKPFCDGTHRKVGFDGTETASRQTYAAHAQEIDGPTLALTDAEPLCAFGRFCDRDGKVWNTVSRVQSDSARQAFSRQVGQCPSGRLVAWDLASRNPVEPERRPSIVLVEDPQQGVSGPLWVRGGIEIVATDGVPYEIRNRVTLCRCGQSNNKPFCDGTHASVGFSDK